MKCYVWDCSQDAVIFIEMTTQPYKRLPCCQCHADAFPSEYQRLETDNYGKRILRAKT